MIKVRRENEHLARDVVIPFSFFQHELSSLDDISLRSYLYLVAITQQGVQEIDEAEIAERFSLSPQVIADVLKYLERRNLIVLHGEGIEICDLRRVHGERALHQTNENDSNPIAAVMDEREGVIRQINDTFYSGIMPLPFYHAIEHWFRDYGFEGPVIYALFNELKRYNTLHSDTYAEKIAANWAQRHIRTFDDLSAYHEEQNDGRKAINLLQKRLRQNTPFSQYQLEYLNRWLDTWAFPVELIDEAFRRASIQSNQINFNYVEGILRNWLDAGVQNLEDMARYEEQRRSERSESYYKKDKRTRKTSQSNFEQRVYSDDSFTDYYRSLDFLDDETEQALTQAEEGESFTYDAHSPSN